jgi:hypothetical protein
MARRMCHGQSYDKEDWAGDGRATLLEAVQSSRAKRPVAAFPAGEGARALSGSGGTFAEYSATGGHEALSPFHREESKAAPASCAINNKWLSISM